MRLLPGAPRYILHLLIALLALDSTALARDASDHPNVVVIIADDLSFADVGFNGCVDIPTPNIDALAANGALCSDGYITHPFCSPSRAGLMTGRYQQRFGYENQPLDDASNSSLGLPNTEYTLADLLKPAGYVCGAIGKWHLGYAPNFHPDSRGFDEFFGFLDGQSDYFNATVWRDWTPVIETEYLTDAFSREAESFITRHAAQPFFLYLAYNAPHTPYQVTQEYLDRVPDITDPGRRTYAAMIVALDDGVGRVVQALEAQGLLENTLIFFLSDNGAPLHRFTSNLPLRGYKFDVLEGGIRVPFAMQWTGTVPAQLIYHTPVISLDIVPTVAAAAGVTLPADRVYDGLNLVPFLTDRQLMPARALYWRWFGLGPNGPPGSLDTIYAVRAGSFKLVTERAATDEPPALYNLTDDIGETENVASTYGGMVSYLSAFYKQWNNQLLLPLWTNRSAFTGVPLVLAGDWNGFNKDDTSPPWGLTRFTAPNEQPTPDGYNVFTSTIHVATTGGDTTPGQHTFNLIGHRTYDDQWGSASINIDNTTALTLFSGSDLGPPNSISFDDGYYYSVRLLDPLEVLPTTLNLAVMKTSAPPVLLSWTGQTPPTPTSEDPVVVTASTSQPPSPEERIYLRWTTNNFVTSTLIPVSGSGASYSATIPPQPANSLLQYSIVSSTASLDSFTTTAQIDPLTLATTGIYNTIIKAPDLVPPSITVQPSDTTVPAGTRAHFSVQASGSTPLRYQWKKNNVRIRGANQTSYTTPPTTPADNGSIYTVTISNAAGKVTSDGAVLTVQ